MEANRLKRALAISFTIIVLILFISTFIPNAWSQQENVKVLSYSWYISDLNSFIVVGEVQNVGQNNIEYIALSGLVNSTDGDDQAWSTTTVYSNEILPQQKVPFVMYFFIENSLSDSFNWNLGDLNNVEFGVIVSNETDNYQYPDLEILDDSSSIGSEGVVTVTGNVWNTGNETSGKLWVVATFYNATGSVIATGFSDYLIPDYLQANQTVAFTVNTIDAIPELVNEMRSLAYSITDYSLLIQTESPIIPEFPSWTILPLLLFGILLVFVCNRKLTKNRNKQQ